MPPAARSIVADRGPGMPSPSSVHLLHQFTKPVVFWGGLNNKEATDRPIRSDAVLGL